jgi:lysophospholipase L1-like esterase
VRPPVVYVALGASDAVGVGADNPLTQGYVPRIIARLPAHSQALNLGISGITLHRALTAELPQVAPEHPTLITVWLAGNDFRGCAPLPQYRADLDTLLTTLHTQTSAQVFVANLPDMSELPSFQHGAPGAGPCVAGKSTAEIRQLVEQWNSEINSVVAQHGDVLVNLFTSDLLAHPNYISQADGFHPSSEGYAKLADLFWTQITAHHAVPNA